MNLLLKRTSTDIENWEPGPAEIVLGVDIVELVSSSLYTEPLSIYREYIQNAADAIDDARAAGVLKSDGRVDLSIDARERTVRIRDNGVGVTASEFVRRLTAFGASEKRGRQRRGFRGVGRLAGVGYCQELLFRSRTAKDQPVRELRWDCRSLRASLRAAECPLTLAEAVQSATSLRAASADGYPERFFEVELRGITRHGNDDLLNPVGVQSYLGQVGPVPFSPDFRFGRQIEEFLWDVPTPANLQVHVNGNGPLYRPHRDVVELKPGMKGGADELQCVTVPGVDGGIAAKGWVLHHPYMGAIPRQQGIRGLRLRTGNLQVGDDATLDLVFQESRFNSWSIGEFHVLDARIVPNGRRDQYEASAHFSNLLNQLGPIARGITLRCRTRSQHRQLVKKGERLSANITSGLAVLRQGALSKDFMNTLRDNLQDSLSQLLKVSEANQLSASERVRLKRKVASLRDRLARIEKTPRISARLRRLTPQKRGAYAEVFSLIYKSAGDLRHARELVDRVLAKVGR